MQAIRNPAETASFGNTSTELYSVTINPTSFSSTVWQPLHYPANSQLRQTFSISANPFNLYDSQYLRNSTQTSLLFFIRVTSQFWPIWKSNSRLSIENSHEILPFDLLLFTQFVFKNKKFLSVRLQVLENRNVCFFVLQSFRTN